MARTRVAVVSVAGDIGAAVWRGIDLLGGIERYVRPGALVALNVHMVTRAAPNRAG